MATVVRMPAALAGVTEAAIQTWIAQPGAEIAAGDLLAEIETEKAVVEFPSEVAGTVGRLLVTEGANVDVGTPIAVILAPGETEDAIAPALAAAGANEVTPALAPAEPVVDSARPDDEVRHVVGSRLAASPIVRRLARERHIDLTSVPGTGPGGRIVRRDLDAVPPATAPSGPVAAPAPAPVEATDIPLTPMRRAIARRLTESKTTVPHFYLTAHCNVDRLIELRRQVNEVSPRKVSVNDFVLKAVAAALVEVPAANAIWAGDHITRFGTVDIAVAVAVDDGLLTPVLRDVANSSLTTVSTSVGELAERARDGKLKQHELEGGAFAVSNLGMYGVDDFAAILNPPQSGILAVGAAKPRPWVLADGSLGVAAVMTVTLSADHRVIDGALGAQLMAAVVRHLENPVTALL